MTSFRAIARQALTKCVQRFGYDLVTQPEHREFPPDLSEQEIATWHAVRRHTMTPQCAVISLVRAVDYVVANNIPGAIVECGVWRGGSAMAAALTLKQLGVTRDIYLYDTFSGMPEGSVHDVNWKGETAVNRAAVEGDGWAAATLNEVTLGMDSTGYTAYRCIVGKVEDTIPQHMPDAISILRLDTDFYESTRHELTHLYPRLSPGGILIIDDYGHWQGARKAVDEYFADQSIYLSRIDTSVRLWVKRSKC
ncbi:MAG: TylF/MycF family methyltransferase [Planctomycetes bacterium]|nr:TylF/MycF family methyltransferase [Planctomycetota bacterium]